jgi:predicted AAA+ superfamily ATPase
MAITSNERVGKAMELLRQGLVPFVEREYRSSYGAQAVAEAVRVLGEDRLLAKKPMTEWDVAALLKLMWESWNDVFRKTLGPLERTLVSELRDARNRWAHQTAFSTDDAYRALDSAGRLLTAVSARQAQEVDAMKMDLLRVRFDEQARSERRKTAGTAVEGAALSTLPAWRDVITPHPDVASGRFQQAEFAADLWQVYLGEGSDEYRDPKEFFRRTYLTESLKRMLVGAVERLSAKGGDPVVQLQTNFGGGKTHSMLALFHLFSGAKTGDLAGADAVLAEAGVKELPKARRVVLVGNKISPGNPVKKADGTIVRTLWGELAWQLGGKKAYARIAEDDARATSPGDALKELFREYGPCLVLVDEWVAYARQLHDEGDLPGGTFDTQFSFAQTLTESAKNAGNCLLVISLPASDTGRSPHAEADDAEVGGLRGREALDRLRNVVGRLESSWRPATAEEGFEIVRRRLFEPLTGEKFKHRDLVAREFYQLYQTQKSEFPSECSDIDYEKRIKAAYPIHPEIFDRLYNDWSTLLKFQRTRGVLRLMATVIHSLWEKGDKNPLILPSTIPIDDSRVQFELTRYLSDNWVPVIERDVDGPNSLPLRLDAEITNLGKVHACRRVARTIYLGSAPTATAAHKGIEDRRIRLGCVMPGESVAVFGDALRRLAAAATYLYEEAPRYWYSTQPTVTKLADDKAADLLRRPEKVAAEVERRLALDARARGDFARVHVAPRSPSEVPDERATRMVVLGVEQTYSKEEGNAAATAARAILDSRGSSPRMYQNALIFLAADKARLQDLDEAVRRYLAWDEIVDQKDALELAPQQVKQAEAQRHAADGTVISRLPEAYQWLLVPTQADPHSSPAIQAIRLSGGEGLVARALSKLKRDEHLVVSMGPSVLRAELEKTLWRGNNHAAVRQLADDFARYLYLPRLSDTSVLTESISQGLNLTSWDMDAFGYASAWDEKKGRYRDLIKPPRLMTISEDDPGILVRADVARAQLDAEEKKPVSGEVVSLSGTATGRSGATATLTVTPGPKPPKRFHGSVRLDPLRLGRDAGKIAEEVLQHLTTLPDAEVEVTLEIQATMPGGAPEKTVRAVSENARTLKFETQGFEEE